MNRIMLVLLMAVIVIAGCDKISHRKTPGGLTYQLYKGKKGEKVYKGNYIKIFLEQKVNDSVYFTSRDKLPIYILVAEGEPYEISETFANLREGDSVVAVQMMDTFIRKNKDNPNFPKHFKNGDRIVTHLKVLGVFTHDSLKTKDQQAVEAQWLAKEIKEIQRYLSDKKVNAQKTPSGSFVEVLNPGTGNLIDSGKYVYVNYTGTSFSGVTFDSNLDTAFHHVTPLTFTVGTGEMIKGFDEAMKFLRPGGSARIYIPSMLGYKDRPQTALIKPLEHLIFDVTVVDVKDKNPNAEPPMPPRKVDMPQPK